MGVWRGYRDMADPDLRKLIAGIDMLEAKVDGRMQYQKVVEDLRGRQDQLLARIGKSAASGEEEWVEFAGGIDEALSHLQAKLEEACYAVGLPVRRLGVRTSPKVPSIPGRRREAA
jgi:hypothetical protein